MITTLAADYKGRFVEDRTVGRVCIASNIAGALSTGNAVFSFRNTGTNNVIISLLSVGLYFNGVNTAGVEAFGILRFTTATPSGGSAITPVSTDSSKPLGFTGDCRFATGALTVTSVVFESSYLWADAVDQQDASSNRSVPALENGSIVLHPGEGIALVAIGATLANVGYSVNMAFYTENQ